MDCAEIDCFRLLSFAFGAFERSDYNRMLSLLSIAFYCFLLFSITIGPFEHLPFIFSLGPYYQAIIAITYVYCHLNGIKYMLFDTTVADNE
jgi:hypothetical protein